MDKFDINEINVSMFLEETKEQLEKIEQELLELESLNDNQEAVNSIFRMVHSIKGAAATMSFNSMSRLAHNLENLLDLVRNKSLIIDDQITDIFLKSVDSLKCMHNKISNNEDIEVDIEDIILEIDGNSNKEKCYMEVVQSKKDDMEVSTENINKENLELDNEERIICSEVDSNYDLYKIVVIMEPTTKMICIKAFLIVNNLMGIGEIVKTDPENFEELSDENFGYIFKVIIASNKSYEAIYNNINAVSEIRKILINKVRKGSKKGLIPDNVKILNSNEPVKKEENATIRVDVSKIDKLLNLVGELVIDKESLNQLGVELKKKYKNDITINKLLNNFSHISYIGSELQETVMSTRMLSMENLFNRFPRMVRDLGKRCGKEVNFVIEGKHTEIDRGIIEELVDPLTHTLRNAIDHGLECIEDRKKYGKNEIGLLRLSAKHEENSVVIEIEDDGRGIDAVKIGKKALEKKITSPEKLKEMTDSQILNFIFEPGFSTAEEVSDISGRGVGLDVVKSNLSKLNGHIQIKTEVGKGTKFRIKLPMTLAIVQALLIKEEEYIFALPITSIIETVRLKGNEIRECIHKNEDIEIFKWREEIIPVVRLGEYFKINNNHEKNKMFIVIIGVAEKKIGIIVQKFLREQEIVIKSLGDFIGNEKLFGDIKGISGVSILGDGSFAQVLDVSALSRR